jgi:hypothetical protein
MEIFIPASSLIERYAIPCAKSRRQSIVRRRNVGGLGTVDERRLMLIDFEKLMSSSDRAPVEQASVQ